MHVNTYRIEKFIISQRFFFKNAWYTKRPLKSKMMVLISIFTSPAHWSEDFKAKNRCEFLEKIVNHGPFCLQKMSWLIWHQL